jgi:hypothetical protein
VRYNVSYDNSTEAAYRRSIFDYNLALARQLNELAGPEVAVSGYYVTNGYASPAARHLFISRM